MNFSLVTKSIRWRLLMWIAALLGLMVTVLAVAAYEIHWSRQVGVLDEDLQERVAELSSGVYTSLRPEARTGAAPAELNATRLETLTLRYSDPGDGYYFAVWKREGERGSEVPYLASTNISPEVTRPEASLNDTGTYMRTRANFRECYHATERGDCVLVGCSLTAEIEDAWDYAGWLTLGGFGVLLVGLGVAWLIIGQALQPVKVISEAAEHIAAGKLSERIDVADADSELGQLVMVLNSTFAKLEASFLQQKHFTADAAHELRTPLAVLISEAQTTLAHDRDAAGYREAVINCLETAQQMRRLTDSMLQLARLDAGQERLRYDTADLASLTQDCMKLVQPLAAKRNLTIRSDLTPVEIVVDAERIKQVVTNLLTNAVRYNRPRGEIKVVTRNVDGHAVLVVADTGQGIAPADLPHVFERFYRADKSRSTDGNGLGLAICHAIVRAHGGTLEAQSEPGSGATFTLGLPAKQNSAGANPSP